jgi:GNAT superfamily N-acetyltransferase
MMRSSAMAASSLLSDKLQVRPIGLDDYADVRYLHAQSLSAQTLDVLTDEEVAAFKALVYSPAYTDLLMQEEVYGAWLDRDLVGTVSWHAIGDDGQSAGIGPVFVHYARLGIGRRLLAEAEARAHQSGFDKFAGWATANAVPFFERLGYRIVSRGVKSLSPGCSLPVAFLRKELVVA